MHGLFSLSEAQTPHFDLSPYQAAISEQQGRYQASWRGHQLSSVLQPIVSFSHSRIIGYEALIRVNSPLGSPLNPPDFLNASQEVGQLDHVDRLCRLLHIANAQNAPDWLFLNVHPALFNSPLLNNSGAFLQAAQKLYGRAPQDCMLEVVEEAVSDIGRLTAGVERLRAAGVGLALDDFGAGHSNFDRVWLIKPDIVKLDRSFAVRASQEASVRRLLPGLVSLLHEAGSLVLLEGIETQEQALIAMDANIDFGQGWHFARPAAQPMASNDALSTALDELWLQHSALAHSEQATRHKLLAPYLNAIGYASALLAGGVAAIVAAQSFIELAHTECFYLLDQEGRQVGSKLNARASEGLQVLRQMGDHSGARWSLRPYFRRAMEHPGKPQITRPYVSISSGRLCITVSCHLLIGGRSHVVCGDIDWTALGGDGH